MRLRELDICFEHNLVSIVLFGSDDVEQLHSFIVRNEYCWDVNTATCAIISSIKYDPVWNWFFFFFLNVMITVE